MKTICIETSPSAAIGGGIRYYSNDAIYSTFQNTIEDKVRDHNLARFQKEVKKVCPDDIVTLLKEDNNIQIVHNEGISLFPWLYPYPEQHPILSKTWMVDILFAHKLESYLPASLIIPKEQVNMTRIINEIKMHFTLWSKIVIKHAWIDGNGSGVDIIEYKNGASLQHQIQWVLEKFSKGLNGNRHELFASDYLLQEYISDALGEGSITFSLQNNRIENLWLANNVVIWWEYFWSSNVFPYMDRGQSIMLSNKLQKDFLPLLTKLRQEGVRGNVWFDILFQNQWWTIKTYVLECNGIHRMTGSLMPSNFAYNTQNPIFVWLPIAQKYLADNYQWMSQKSLLQLAQTLAWFWVKEGKPQIMNIKCEWHQRWHPVVWIASAWDSQKDLFQLFYDSKITNNRGNEYISNIFEKMT